MQINGLPTTNPVPGTQIRVVQGRAAFRPTAPESEIATNTQQLQTETKLLLELASRDREVRAHEAAHAIVGGQYASAPRFSYQTGPNGRNYAVGGKVAIDTAPIPGDPQGTLRKAEMVRSAALAPVKPSPPDMTIAAKAAQMAIMARAEITLQEGRDASQARSEQHEEATSSAHAAVETYRQIQNEA